MIPASAPIPYRCWDGLELANPTAGYQRHRARGEPPCAACRRMAAQDRRDRRLAPQRRAVLEQEVAIFENRQRKAAS